MNIYSKCTECYDELTDEEIKDNASREIYNYPICQKCLDKGIVELSKIIEKD